MQELPLIIAGREVPGEGELYEIRNPADPKRLVAVGRSASRSQIDYAIEAASVAAKKWRSVPGPQRGAVLYEAAELLAGQVPHVAAALTQEEGKTLSESTAEVARAVETLRFFGAFGRLGSGETLPSSQLSQFIYSKREPLGVVGLITPWNFPLAIPTQKLAPAIVAGNAVVLKPSSYTPAIALRLCRILMQAGVPEGTLSLLIGPGPIVGQALLGHRSVGAVSFTGSNKVGTELAKFAAGRFVRLQLEMGGKNPLIVLADADLENAVEVAARGAFGLTGQSCTATGRIVVERSAYGNFIERLAARAGSITTGDGLDPSVQMGPKVARTELNTALTRLHSGLANGDAQLVWGRIDEPGHSNGYFLPPVVLKDVDPASELGREELFSPIACLMPVEGFDEAIDLCNASTFGLSAAICTRNLRHAHEFVERIEAGVVKVNASTTGLELHVPFGGFKQSSNGASKELGSTAIEFFTRSKSVYLTYG